MKNRQNTWSGVEKIIDSLCKAAKEFLIKCYSIENSLPYSIRFGTDGRWSVNSFNLRYALISQIGIANWNRHHSGEENTLPDLWDRIASHSSKIRSGGNLGLAIWAGTENDFRDCDVFIDNLVKKWTELKRTCEAVDLSWIIQGLVTLIKHHSATANEVNHVLKEAHKRLIGLYDTNTKLFYRHDIKDFKHAISRSITSFADQVYPILALAHYGKHFKDARSIDIAASVADSLCQLQGPNGQWWWHYDVKKGTVAEEYPVYSVHQDSMAPLALIAVDEAAGTDHSDHIKKGLMWLSGENELGVQMISLENHMIFRDIHRREIPKMYRILRGSLSFVGLTKLHQFMGKNMFGYILNMECRPYHPGWILFSWAEYSS
jgi:hypothetical protein